MISMSAASAARGNPLTNPTIAAPLRWLGWAVVCACSACASSPGAAPGASVWDTLSPYKVEVVQGNVVTREQAALIKPGMGRAEVRDILGSPLLTDVFHGDRWDYVFSIRRQGAAVQRRHVSVVFKQDKVVGFEADELPAEREFNASIATTRKTKVPELSLSPAEVQALPVPASAPTAAPAAAAGTPPRSYPPLEATP